MVRQTGGLQYDGMTVYSKTVRLYDVRRYDGIRYDGRKIRYDGSHFRRPVILY